MARSSTTFQPGRSANPSGRPKLTPEQRDAREALRATGPEVVARLSRLLNSRDERVAATVALGMAKMIGLAEPDRVEVSNPTESSPLAGASVDELVTMLAMVRERAKAAS